MTMAAAVAYAYDQIDQTLVCGLALNRSVHRLDQVSWSLAPQDGVSSVVEIVEQVLDLWAGVQRSVAVVFLQRIRHRGIGGIVRTRLARDDIADRVADLLDRIETPSS